MFCPKNILSSVSNNYSNLKILWEFKNPVGKIFPVGVFKIIPYYQMGFFSHGKNKKNLISNVCFKPPIFTLSHILSSVSNNYSNLKILWEFKNPVGKIFPVGVFKIIPYYQMGIFSHGKNKKISNVCFKPPIFTLSHTYCRKNFARLNSISHGIFSIFHYGNKIPMGFFDFFKIVNF